MTAAVALDPSAVVAGLVRRHAVDEADEAELLDMLGFTPRPERVRQAKVRPVIRAARHGSRAAYVAGCRCGWCTAANTAYVAAWRSRGCCPVTGRARLRLVVLEEPCGRGRHRVWPGQLALVVTARAAREKRTTVSKETEK